MLICVAPHAGAWIETKPGAGYHNRYTVAPHAGAWIETRVGGDPSLQGAVAPHAGAWIETTIRHNRARGKQSPPMRGRGLKLMLAALNQAGIGVAPHAGAWIETLYKTLLYTASDSRPPCGGVD